MKLKTVLLFCIAATISAMDATAQHKVSEEWTTYCDNGTEKVRVALTYRLAAIGFDDFNSEWLGTYTEPCAGDCKGPDNRFGTLESLGNDHYRWTWEGWAQDCLGAEVWRFAMMSYIAVGEFGPELRMFFVQCDDGPQTIMDTADCSPLPSHTLTWGAIKALYR